MFRSRIRHASAAAIGRRTDPRAARLWRIAVLSLGTASLLASSACRPASSADEAGIPVFGVGPGYGVEGLVVALLQDETIGLVGASVTLLSGVTPVDQTSTRSSGNYAFSGVQAGSYTVSVSLTGFQTATASATVVASDVYVAPIALVPQGQALFGKLTTPDDSPTHFEFPAFGVSARASVSVVDTNDVPIFGPVPVDDSGRYVLPGLGSGSHQLRAQLGWTVARANVAVSGHTRSDLLLDNHRPLVSLYASRAGTPVKRASHGDTLDVEADTFDADGDALHYAWRASRSNGPFVSVDGPDVTWNLPEQESLSFLYVLVSDQTSYALRRLPMRATSLPARFSGTIRDAAGAAIVGARVAVNGLSTLTDANGFYSLTLAARSRYALTVFRFGYETFSTVLYDETTENDLVLRPAQVFSGLSASAVISVGSPGQPRVTIPANALIDQNGVPVTGTVSVALSAIDPFDVIGGFPGDNTGRNAFGQIVRLESYGAIGIDVRSANGAPLDLRSGTSAMVVVPESNPNGPGPATIPVWWFDEDEGIWIREPGVATLSGGDYSFSVAHFSVFNLDIEFASAACVKLIVADNFLPAKIKITILEGPQQGQEYFTTLADPINVLVRLPPNTDIQIQSVDQYGAASPASAQIIQTGGPTACALDLDPPYPYTDCCSKEVYLDSLAPDDGEFLSRIQSTAADAAAYYDEIDPFDAKDTLAEWKTENGFGQGSPSEITVAYFNGADLSFGRRMSMVRNGTPGNEDIAYYVTNYASAADAANDISPIATVAMEHSRHPQEPSGDRYTKFYVFNAVGTRVELADLDGRGDKYIPGLCLICHKGQDYDPTALGKGKLGARFIPFDLDSFGYFNSGTWTRADQEPEFREMNRGILEATDETTTIRDLVEGWYQGSGLPGVFDGTWVPSGWSGASANALYRDGVAKYCRSCHATRDSVLSFATFADIDAYSPYFVLCDKRDMPHAKTTYQNFWADPDAVPAFANALSSWPGPCPK